MSDKLISKYGEISAYVEKNENMTLKRLSLSSVTAWLEKRIKCAELELEIMKSLINNWKFFIVVMYMVV